MTSSLPPITPAETNAALRQMEIGDRAAAQGIMLDTLTREHRTLPPTARLDFVLAGNAVFTVANPATGKRFTYKVRQNPRKGPTSPHFVSVLIGPDNQHDYMFIGTIFDKTSFVSCTPMLIPESGLAFRWLWRRLASQRDIAPAMLYHEGRCGRCGRLLTVPESVLSGIGPECQKKMGRPS